MYIELGALVYEHKHCNTIFVLSKLTLDVIRSMHADFYDLPDAARLDNTSANSLNQKIKLLEEVTMDDSEPSQQTI